MSRPSGMLVDTAKRGLLFFIFIISFSSSDRVTANNSTSNSGTVTLIENGSCGMSNVHHKLMERLHAGTQFHFHRSFDNEKKFSMAITWVGENSARMLVVNTEEINFIFRILRPSSLYLSEDNGKDFTDISARIESGQIKKVNGLQKHPIDKLKIFLVCYGKKLSSDTDIWITEDGARTFKKNTFEYILEDFFRFHPKNSQVMMVKDTANNLHASFDGGHSWSRIRDNVGIYRWASIDEIVIFVARKTSPNPSQFLLERSDDRGKSWKKILTDVYSFGVQGKFLFATIPDPHKSGGRIMMVSTNLGESIDPAQLPSIGINQFLAIVDMSEGLIFLHVDEPNNTGYGTLYTSGSNGLIFSKSLTRHLYPNRRQLTDFYKVESMRGVYIASQIREDKSIVTVITHNFGAEWHPISRPAGSACRPGSVHCYLEISNLFSISHGVHAQPPLSSPNAPGVILVHGHVADSERTEQPDVYISNDGGYNWFLALHGPHHYQIAGHGGLIVAVAAITSTPKILKFSTDGGHCWYRYEFTRSELELTGLMTEPGNRAFSVSIWGFGKVDRTWRVHTFNLSALIPEVCTEKDFDLWTPHTANGKKGCLLGRKQSFKFAKLDSFCRIDFKMKHVATVSEVCACTRDDFQCEFGYTRRLDNSECRRDQNVKSIDICLRGHEEKIVTEGYRKLPNDVCRGGFAPKGKLVQLPDRCALPFQKSSKSHKTATVVLLLLVAVLAVSAVSGAVYVRRKRSQNYSLIDNSSRFHRVYQNWTDDEPPLSPEPRPRPSNAESDTEMLL